MAWKKIITRFVAKRALSFVVKRNPSMKEFVKTYRPEIELAIGMDARSLANYLRVRGFNPLLGRLQKQKKINKEDAAAISRGTSVAMNGHMVANHISPKKRKLLWYLRSLKRNEFRNNSRIHHRSTSRYHSNRHNGKYRGKGRQKPKFR